MSLSISIDPQPQFDLSPRLYMQFMEPLGITDASVEAGWDFISQSWRSDFVDRVRALSPGCIRWGGIYSSFWKWREGIGPRDRRVPAYNYAWGGMETNQIGMHEIVALCRLASAEPLMSVNFAADGRPEYIHTPAGEDRAGSAAEAADLVSYCNDPDHAERRANGAEQPFGIKLWQLGNETSYPPPGARFTSRENVEHYLAFAKAMRARDESIQLIGWGDQESGSDRWWATDLIEAAGDLIDYVAIHMMNQHPSGQHTLLSGREYARDRDLAWEQLGGIYRKVVDKLEAAIQVVHATGSTAKIAITEGHLSLSPHNTNPLLNEWLAGLYSARVMNLYERHGDRVEVATLADFFGTRWTVNAVMLGSPRQPPFLMPAGIIMKLFGQHHGRQGLRVPPMMGALDISASRTDDVVYLHVVNTDLHSAEKAQIRLAGSGIRSAKVLEIAPGDLEAYVDHDHADTFDPVEHEVRVEGNVISWRFPPASVSIVMLTEEGSPRRSSVGKAQE